MVALTRFAFLYAMVLTMMMLGSSFRLISRRAPALGLLRMQSASTSAKKVVFLGTPDVAANSLRILLNEADKHDIDIAAVVTQPPAPAGRKKKLTKSPVHLLAEERNVPVFYPEKATNASFLEDLEALQPDLCITAAYGNYLPKRFLACPQFGTLNIHPSLLPKYRGAAPVQRCLENGDAQSGVTVLFTVTKMDAGPIVRQVVRPLRGDEKATEFLRDMFEVGTHELLDALPGVFDKSAELIEQDETQVSHADKMSADDSRIDFSSMNALTIHNRVRGFSDWPGTWSTFRIGDHGSAEGEVKMKIISTVVLNPIGVSGKQSEPSVQMEKVANPYNPEGKKIDVLKVVCGDGSELGLVQVQPASKKAMDAKSFMNGLRGAPLSWTVPAQQVAAAAAADKVATETAAPNSNSNAPAAAA